MVVNVLDIIESSSDCDSWKEYLDENYMFEMCLFCDVGSRL